MHTPKIIELAKYECTGCAACVNICPYGYIQMKSNEEGFLYPTVAEECLGCGMCDKVCPILANKTQSILEIPQYAVAAVSLSRDIRQASSSGGAFSEICKAYGDSETVVFGARFDGLNVVHSYVVGVKNIRPFCKSKYVQSEIGLCFSDAKNFLENGTKVIFSGTPCQIAGLKSYLGKHYAQLLCIDIICHGVGSPSVFRDMLLQIEKKFRKKIINYSFRNRIERLGNWRDYVCRYEFNDGKVKYELNDPYQELFISQLCLRSCCGESCKFRNKNRNSDITIADFKGKFKIFPKMMDHRNYSTIIVNSRKGNIVFKSLLSSMKIRHCRLNNIEQFNPLFFKTTRDNPNRDKFFKLYSKTSQFDELIANFIPYRPSWKKFARVKDVFIPFHLKRMLSIIFYELGTIKRICKPK
jgi:coenzyme F420-reducing hydrogenase beta subunit